VRVIITTRGVSQTHPTSILGAKKRLIATHPSSEILVTPGESKSYQFLIATLKRFGAVEMLGLGDAEERFFDSASRPEDRKGRCSGKNKASGCSAQNDGPRRCAAERGSQQSQALSGNAITHKSRAAHRRPQLAALRPRLTKYGSPITALTTPSPQLLSLPAHPLWYSRRVIRVPPIGLRAPAPARLMVREGLPPARTQEVILCAF
jgi:hypothetical protein